MNTTIFFDMDGTIANFYGVENWLDYLIASDPTPYAVAKPLLHMATLARTLNRLQKQGYRIGIISWLSKSGTEAYNQTVTETKLAWLTEHMPSVHFDEINIVKYGTPKQMFAHSANDILFDDEQPNRNSWTGKAYNVDNIINTLLGL